MFSNICHSKLLASSALAGLVVLGADVAQAADPTYQFNIPAESLSQALMDFSQTSSQQIIYSEDLVRGRNTSGLHGSYNTAQALKALLSGTDLEVRINADGVLMVQSKKNQAASNEGAAQLPEPEEVVVTGSRIKGAPPVSPVIELTQSDMIKAGQSDLGEAVRSIPENFSGGQNPGVQQGASKGGLSNQDVTGGSTINLRGLGPDATLTLLDGHRLAYDGFSQGVDISTIPLAALDRLEINADGASAIYGSDAVAGVANVILKHDFEGFEASALVGQATEGGDFQQQYDATTGAKWSDGGLIVSYDFSSSTKVDALQRGFTSFIGGPNSIYPNKISNSVVFSGHQDLADFATFDIDLLFNRKSSTVYQTVEGVYTDNTARSNTTFFVSPTLDFRIGGGWEVSLNGTYAKDDVRFNDRTFYLPPYNFTSTTRYCYCNSALSGEVNAQGELFDLPGGAARADFGGGWKKTEFDNTFAGGNSASNIEASRHSYYAYGELLLPLLSKDQDIPLVDTLSATAAIRYEKYSDFGGLVTPKLGVIYEPDEDFALKGSWGQSFKAPTLDQEYINQTLYIFPANEVGGVGYGPDATILLPYGGNANLTAERASTWTATVDVHPRWLDGFQTQISYFNILYKDRIVQPIPVISATLSDPNYAPFVNYNPTMGEQNALFAQISDVRNFSAAPYDPASVVAIGNDQYINAASQHIDGIDIFSSYDFETKRGTWTIDGDLSWMESDQKNSRSSSAFQLAGTVFEPPHMRARGGISWTEASLNLSGFVNYIGGVRNTLVTPNQHISSMTTFDVSASYSLLSTSKWLNNTSLVLAIVNLTDARPPMMENPTSDEVRYDSTNYPALGRFISLRVSKQF